MLIGLTNRETFLNYRWVIGDNADTETLNTLSDEQHIPPSITKILLSRGIVSAESAEQFFAPSLEHLHSPFLMDGMEKAVVRIEQAVAAKETIWIYGDYDVDGTSSTAILLHFLRGIGAMVDYVIPDRFTQGYGISADVIDLAEAQNVRLIISVDTGITSIGPIELARSVGIDFIICDHHEPSDRLPPAFAILDPIKGNCPYPFKFLAASGVVFKLVHAMCIRRNEPDRAFEYLDLVAVASSADMVPLVDENRILVHYGLKILNESPRSGFRAIYQCTNLRQGTLNSSSIMFNIAPRINAAGRIGDASKAVQLMLSEDEIESFRIAQDLESKNYQRRVFDEETFIEARKMADEYLATHKASSLVLYNPKWHVGVINIVASRLVEAYYLPTILLTQVDAFAKGSARSIRNYDVHSALKHCANLLVEFGGHKYAAGLSLKPENVEKLRHEFDAIARKNIKPDMFTPELHIDAEVQFNEFTPRFVELVEKFAPFGYQNNKPMFLSKGVTCLRRASIVGKNHLRMKAKQGNYIIDAIGFNLGEKLHICNSGKPFSIVYTLEETTYQQRRSLQLYIKDIVATTT